MAAMLFAMSSTDSSDLVVIGAGIVGLATARALLLRERGRTLVVIEAEARPASHQTGNNSGVLHSGLYYRPGSLKARLCTAGREAMVRYCTERGLPFDRCGKVVVATRPEQVPALDELERRGLENGLEGIQRVGPAGLREHEPHVVGVEGLWIPQTGILDYRAVSEALADDVRELGGEVRLGQAAGAIRPEPSGGFHIEVGDGAVRTAGLVNCGGLHADRIARRAGELPTSRIVPFRGEYKLLVPERSNLVRGLIYPVPDPRFPFLGVHFTRRVDGSVEAGPNAVLALHRHGYSRGRISIPDALGVATTPGFWRMAARYWRTGLAEEWRSLSPGAFARALAELVPEVRRADLRPAGAGVRAQALDPDGTLADDFRITRGRDSFHVLSAPSPAATASLAIGEFLAQEADEHLRP